MHASDGSSEAVELSVDVAARPATVWRCLVEKDLLSRWLAADVALEPRVGGAVRIDFSRYGTLVEGAVAQIRAPELLVLTWGVSRGPQRDAMPAGSTTVEFRLQPIASGTRVTLRHFGLPTEKDRREHAAGWAGYLGGLANLGPAAAVPEGVDSLWDSWFSAWSETDPARRDAILDSCLASEARFRDAHADGTGPAWISAWIGACQRQFPGTKLARSGRALQTRDSLLVRWNALSADGSVVARGVNHGRLSLEGRLSAVEGFWETDA
jgi:uncharacterized protein YndB with AHSA1/START domain